MLRKLKLICIFVGILTANSLAQTNIGNIDSEVGKALLKKDLRQAVKEAEASSATDLLSLFWRLSLYQRSANSEKTVYTVRQIISVSDEKKVGYGSYDQIKYALKDPFFTDTRTLQLYLQLSFDDEIYGRLIDLCLKNRQTCDIEGVDNWLAQKAQETSETKGDTQVWFGGNDHLRWVSRRVDWRMKFGLDNAGILNQFVEDVRKDPSDLDTALAYLKFFGKAQDIEWLAQTFTSEQAYDYYELGENLSMATRYGWNPENDRGRVYRVAVQFFQKSLSLPFNKQDSSLMSRQFRYASITPIVKDHEKQLRFWAKTELAEAYKNLGEPQNAQPIVEELMNLDTSDIVSYKPSQLAGAVQAGSGARVVESKILSEQATRQDSYQYWQERIAYYRGRKEAERVFDAYRQGLSVVPFDLSNETSRGNRLFFVRQFAEFPRDGYRFDADWKDRSEELQRSLLRETEDFLRSEFEKTKSNVRYSYELAEIIIGSEFKQLSDEIFSRNPELLINAAKIDLINGLNGVLYNFLKSENISRDKKDFIANQILKIAEKKTVHKAFTLCEAFEVDGKPNYAARTVPILVKNLKIAESRFNSSKSSDDNYSETEGIKNKYIQILFKAYISADDSKAAEKLLMEKYSIIYDSPLDRLMLNAAKNGAVDDAVRYWKFKANLDRRNLTELDSLSRFPAVAERLRAFYKQMKINEPYSPIPDIALQKLR